MIEFTLASNNGFIRSSLHLLITSSRVTYYYNIGVDIVASFCFCWSKLNSGVVVLIVRNYNRDRLHGRILTYLFFSELKGRRAVENRSSAASLSASFAPSFFVIKNEKKKHLHPTLYLMHHLLCVSLGVQQVRPKCSRAWSSRLRVGNTQS